MYRWLRPFLFSQDPERVHDWTLAVLSRYSAAGLWRWWHPTHSPRLTTRLWGLDFASPIGLAAGLDKNGLALGAWYTMGFGFAELGSVTALPQAGNPKPRLFRLPQDLAIINRMGFNNLGATALAQRLAQAHTPPIPVGINLGKSKAVELDQASADYLQSLSQVWPVGDYFVINVSSPNTPGLRQLQNQEHLEELLAALRAFVQAKPQSKPLLLKIAPDLNSHQLDQIVLLAERYGLNGIIATNTTVGRNGLLQPVQQEGGLSGAPLANRSLEVLRYLRAATSLPLVSVGGIFTAQQVWERLQAGAQLVQLYTSLVYQGPGLPRRLEAGLLRLMDEHGVNRLTDVLAHNTQNP